MVVHAEKYVEHAIPLGDCSEKSAQNRFLLSGCILKLATREEIETIRSMALKVNETLKAFFAECGVRLIDFKLEFGRLSDAQSRLEIAPKNPPKIGSSLVAV